MSATRNNVAHEAAENRHRLIKFFFLIIRLMIVISLVVALYWGWQLYQNPKFMPIKRVKITATYQKIDQQTLTDMITPYIANSSLLSFDMEKLKTTLLEQPWIYQVIVKRIWPDQIAVIIQEQTAVALWNHQSLVNAKGDVFTPPKNTFPANLPEVNCPDGQQFLVLEKLNQFDQALTPLNLAIHILSLNSRGSWQMILTNGIVITLGRNAPEQRFARLISAYPSVLAKQLANIVSIDLRYPDGFAVSWKTLPT